MAGLLGGTTARVHAAQTSPTKTSITTNAGVLAADENPSKHDCKGKGGCNGQRLTRGVARESGILFHRLPLMVSSELS